jgi:perosamine synthetase
MLLRSDATLFDAIKAIDAGQFGIALVIDEERRLLGVVTDRDIRQATLAGDASSSQVSELMTRDPVVAYTHDKDEDIQSKMQHSTKLQIPIIDSEGLIVDLRTLSDFMGVVPLAIPSVKGNEWNYVKNCLDTNQLSSVGPYVDMFEDKIAEYVGSSYAIACISGTSALHTALLMAGVSQDDEVIVPALTFIAPVNAVTYCGAIPAFVDSEWDTMGMCPIALAEFLSTRGKREGQRLVDRETGRRIAGVVVVHAFGHPADMDRLSGICAEWDLPIIEDAAESLGATYKGYQTGNIGQFGALSFNGNKIITAASGGMVLTNDSDCAQHGKHLTTQAKSDSLYYVHDEIGYNYRLSNIHAAIGLAQLEQLDQHVDRKRKIAQQYIEALGDIDGLSVFEEQSWAQSNYWLNTIFVPKNRREDLLRHLNDSEIMARPIWELNTRQVMYRDCPSGPVPTATEIQGRAINLPSSVDISDTEIGFICDTIISWWNEQRP